MAKKGMINLNDLYNISDEKEVQESLENGTKEIEKGTREIEIDKLVSFRNHPFKLYQGERLDDMVASIKEHGIITPLIVRALEDNQYEILSGHNRANAGKIAGLERVPVVVKEDLTDEEAMLIVTETNLIQRSFSELSHSEKARILTERHNAIKSQGKRTDLINEIEMMSDIDGYGEDSSSRQIGENLKSDVEIGKSYDLSPRNVSRYLKIDTLINELKTRLDNAEIPFTAGVDLSFLKEEEQEYIEILLDEGHKIDLKKADILKTFSKGRNFTYDKALEVLSGKYFEKPKKEKKVKFTNSFTKNVVGKYVTEDRSIKDVEKIIEELLENYFKEKENELE